ncbi:uncharacterized protein LOC113389712 [Ctenocephalides felis]|uniref:uncharacterized protein LOC113389712 n=1 Tax=Ctenocephalides felis TaxID=7515 RepID=UPI000E6E26D2|nr:uncharacterized protein LOC113389712 [Ctenocephalides felis]
MENIFIEKTDTTVAQRMKLYRQRNSQNKQAVNKRSKPFTNSKRSRLHRQKIKQLQENTLFTANLLENLEPGIYLDVNVNTIEINESTAVTFSDTATTSRQLQINDSAYNVTRTDLLQESNEVFELPYKDFNLFRSARKFKHHRTPRRSQTSRASSCKSTQFDTCAIKSATAVCSHRCSTTNKFFRQCTGNNESPEDENVDNRSPDVYCRKHQDKYDQDKAKSKEKLEKKKSKCSDKSVVLVDLKPSKKSDSTCCGSVMRVAGGTEQYSVSKGCSLIMTPDSLPGYIGHPDNPGQAEACKCPIRQIPETPSCDHQIILDATALKKMLDLLPKKPSESILKSPKVPEVPPKITTSVGCQPDPESDHVVYPSALQKYYCKDKEKKKYNVTLSPDKSCFSDKSWEKYLEKLGNTCAKTPAHRVNEGAEYSSRQYTRKQEWPGAKVRLQQHVTHFQRSPKESPHQHFAPQPRPSSRKDRGCSKRNYYPEKETKFNFSNYLHGEYHDKPRQRHPPKPFDEDALLRRLNLVAFRRKRGKRSGKTYTAYAISSTTTEETSTTTTTSNNTTTTDTTATTSSTSLGEVGGGCRRFSGSEEGETLSVGEIRGRFRRIV